MVGCNKVKCEYRVYHLTLKKRSIEVKPGSQTAKINGNIVTMECKMEIRNDVGYVPLSFVEIAFPVQGTYDQDKGTLTLADNETNLTLNVDN